jgi:hypothetical protein
MIIILPLLTKLLMRYYKSSQMSNLMLVRFSIISFIIGSLGMGFATAIPGFITCELRRKDMMMVKFQG